MFLFFELYLSINNSLLYMFLYLNDDTGPLQPVTYTFSDSTSQHQKSAKVNNEYHISSILHCSVASIVSNKSRLNYAVNLFIIIDFYFR